MRRKCNRKACDNEAFHRHTQNGELYCTQCARKLNEFFPGLVPITLLGKATAELAEHLKRRRPEF